MAKAITFPAGCSLLSRRSRIILQYLSPNKTKQNPPIVSKIKRCETVENECVGEEIPDDLCGLSKMLPASKLREAQRDTNCVLKRGVCDSWRKRGDYWRECPISEEEGIKNDEQITDDVIVLNNIDVSSILTK